MAFDAIGLIEDAYLEVPIGEAVNFVGPWPLVVKINGNEGYTCDAEGTVDQHTADLLCQKAGYLGAFNWFNRGKPLEKNIRLIITLL